MNTASRIVIQLPLTELWHDDGFTTTTRIRRLAADDIKILLRSGQVQFVIADAGAPLHWIPVGECYNFWKTEIQPHLAAPEYKALLDDFPDSYCYFATEWSSLDGAAPIVACERYH